MINASRILSNPQSTPIAVLSAMHKELDYQWVNWEPEAIWDEIAEEVGVDPPRVNKDKIMALKLCIMTTVPWEDWHPFTVCVLCFNDVPIEMDIAQECSPVQLAYGVQILTRLQPEHVYRRDVQFMAASMLLAKGICWVPQEPLGGIVNEALEHLISKTSKNFEAIHEAKRNYQAYQADGRLDPDDVHTTRLAAIDAYLQHKAQLEAKEVA
jgi:hypothetical protein